MKLMKPICQEKKCCRNAISHSEKVAKQVEVLFTGVSLIQSNSLKPNTNTPTAKPSKEKNCHSF